MKASARAVLVAAALAAPLAVAHAQPATVKSAAPAKPWTPKRTAWGDPDLRGKWPLDYLASTPRVRSPQYGTRAELNDKEYEAAVKAAQNLDDRYKNEVKANTIGMGHWSERGLPLRQTSLTVEPANGRMPPATEEGKRLAALTKSSWSEDHWDSPEDFSPFDRCITRGMPSSMLPGVYNSGIEIFQAPGMAVIRLEMIHEARVIPIGPVSAPPPAVKGWMGYSRGHWEGNSLVIETTNFRPGVPLGNVDGLSKPVPNSAQLHIKERLTPTGPDTIRYEAWVEDPVVLTAPFKLDFPWRRNSDYEEYEYACHEGNRQLRGFITSSRADRAAGRNPISQLSATDRAAGPE